MSYLLIEVCQDQAPKCHVLNKLTNFQKDIVYLEYVETVAEIMVQFPPCVLLQEPRIHYYLVSENTTQFFLE